jgi:hypothetical protein
MSNEISIRPAIIEVTGKTKTERQLSVMTIASSQTKLALANAKGKVGAAARAGIAGLGLGGIAKQAAWPTNNYNPVAEYIAAQLGEPMVISNRAAFESLPDQFEARLMKVKLSKSGGYTTDKKTGALKPNATMSKLMELKAVCVELVAVAAEISADAKAKHAESKATALTA